MHIVKSFLFFIMFNCSCKADQHRNTELSNKITAESAFLFRDREHPVTVPSLGVLNRPTSLSVLKRPQPSLTVLSRPVTGRSRSRKKNADSAVL
jgi:hypothetical protein